VTDQNLFAEKAQPKPVVSLATFPKICDNEFVWIPSEIAKVEKWKSDFEGMLRTKLAIENIKFYACKAKNNGNNLMELGSVFGVRNLLKELLGEAKKP